MRKVTWAADTVATIRQLHLLDFLDWHFSLKHAAYERFRYLYAGRDRDNQARLASDVDKASVHQPLPGDSRTQTNH